jgi:pyridoxal 5'-phosphate synthase pdxS subunit
MRAMVDGIRWVQSLSKEQLMAAAKDLQAPYELVLYVHENGKLPVVNFCAGGVATPADASLMMQLGADGIFVGSGVFKSSEPALRAKAIVEATTHWDNASVVAESSKGLGEAMRGLEISQIPERELLATRGW